MKTIAIVPAAGEGKRLVLRVKKPFVSLGGRPLITYALSALESSKAIDAIIIASDKSSVERFRSIVNRHKFKKVIAIVIGGKTRFDSVKNCLDKIEPIYDIILIHDGARPFIDGSLIERSVLLARKFGGSVVAIPETDTVKLVGKDMFIRKTLDRRHIFRAATPQAFKYDLIKKAYGRKRKGCFTDDSSLAELRGARVKVLEGPKTNIKITTKEDLKLAEVILCG